ncbi:MAG: Rpn family recombination-promoting nuclease/putative transposase [Cyclobacteriaceae bacterium]
MKKKKQNNRRNNKGKNNKISQLHDSYVRSTFSDIKVTKAFIKDHLPVGIVKRIDMNSLQLLNTNFVTKAMKKLQSDVVYSCSIDDKKGYILYSVEHQSTPDKWLPVRILEYNVQLMRQHINAGNATLPIIINEVLYAGTTSPYPFTVDIFELFADPELAKEMLYKPPILTDLTVKTQEELLQEGEPGEVEIVLKQGIKNNHVEWVKNNTQLVRRITNSRLANTHLTYLLETDTSKSSDQLFDAIVEAAPEHKEKIMTAAQQLRQEGRQEGRQAGMEVGIEVGMERGMERGKLETAKNMLKAGSEPSFIEMVTGLPMYSIQELQVS